MIPRFNPLVKLSFFFHCDDVNVLICAKNTIKNWINICPYVFINQ
jgi:hypothetical protein